MANKENITKWVDALKSGEYEQTVGALRNEWGYCCLGVACDVAIKNGLNVIVEEVEGEDVSYDGSLAYLPESVSGWLGLEEMPYALVANNERSLVCLNDSDLWTLDQIAQAIKETYLEDGDVNISVPMDTE